MPNWLFRTPEFEDVTITAKVFKEEAIARSPECISVGARTQRNWIQSSSNPPKRDFGETLRSRHNMTGGGLVGGATHLESSPTPSVRELVNRFEEGSRTSIRQRVGSDAVASESGIIAGSMPHAGPAVEERYLSAASNSSRPPRPFKDELIKKAQARNLSLFGSLDPSFNLANYPEHPFRNPSLGGAIYQPLNFKVGPTSVPLLPVRALPPSRWQRPPASGLADALSRALEDRRLYASDSEYSDDSYEEFSNRWSEG